MEQNNFNPNPQPGGDPNVQGTRTNIGDAQAEQQNPNRPGETPFGTSADPNDPNRRTGTNEDDNFRDDNNSDPNRRMGEEIDPNRQNPYTPSDPGSPRDPELNPPFGGDDVNQDPENPMPREPMV